MYQIIFHPEATNEFDDAFNWYKKESDDIANRFKESILSQIYIVQNNPELFQRRRDGFRESVVHDFPYIVVYKVSKKLNAVTISAIFHTSRNPRKKYRH